MPAGTASASPEPEKRVDPEDKPLWLTAWRDQLAGLRAFTPCIDFCDVNGDGDYKLVVADAAKRLKVFSGTCLVNEGPLLDMPTAVVCFEADYSMENRKPLVAVAYGPFVFIYRNLRPYYKFNLQPVDLTEEERSTWQSLSDDKMDVNAAVELLESVKENGGNLSNRSMDLLAIETPEARAEFVAEEKSKPLVQMSVFTCMAVLKKEGDGNVGCLVLGTESGRILILDKSGAQVHKKVQLRSTPVHLLTSGALDVEYRIVAACRNGHVYIIKNGELRGVAIEIESQIVAMCRAENQLVIATMASQLHFYNLKGTKQTTLSLPAPVTNLCSLVQEHVKASKSFVAALANGEVRVYVGKHLFNKTQVHDTVTAMKVGRYGREDSTLVLVLKSGSLIVNMLPRTANLHPNSVGTHGVPPEQDIPLRVPKRTTLYVELTQREKEFGVNMHRVFQRDLCKLRLRTARSYVTILTDGRGQQSYNTQASVRLTATVQGLGPLFRIRLCVQNTGAKALANVPVVFTYDTALYRLPRPHILISALVPAMVYTFEVPVESVEESNGAGSIRVYLCDSRSSAPIVTALINMPMPDALAPPQP